MQAELRDPLENLFPDSQVGRPPRTRLTLDAARGGTLAVHVLLNHLAPQQSVQVRIREDGRLVRHTEVFELIDVPVEQNTGLRGFTERTAKPNPHVIRRAPFRTYDAMKPVDGCVVPATTVAAMRIHIPVRRSAVPGVRTLRIEIEQGKQTRTLALKAHIHQAKIPAVSSRTLPNTNWCSTSQIAIKHGLRPWSKAHWQMIAAYARLMVHARQNMFLIHIEDVFQVDGDGVSLLPGRLRQLVKIHTDAGLHFIEGGPLAYRTDRFWDATTFDVKFGGRATHSEGDRVLRGLCQQLYREIGRNGWQDRWMQHVADEPRSIIAEDYRILTGMVRKYMPGIKIMDATVDTDLYGSVDVWCPQAHRYQRHQDAYDDFKARGDQIWFYTCCCPGGPWLNRFLDQELLRPALFGWAISLFNLDGHLRWGFNEFEQEDPLSASVIKNYHGGESDLSGGDTHIVYPGPTGPWSSLRLEAQREGFEDLELLRQLEAQDPGRAKALVRRVIQGFDQYTKDIAVMRSARRMLYRALRQ